MCIRDRLEKVHDAHFFRVQRVLETGGNVGNLREKDREQEHMGDVDLPDPPQDTRGRDHETGIAHRAAVNECRRVSRNEDEYFGGVAESVVCLLYTSRISNNLGDSKSLVTHPATTTHQRLTPEARSELGISEGFIRFSAGLEHRDDLIEDLQLALERV